MLYKYLVITFMVC